MTSLEIRPSRFGAPAAQRMVAAAQQELTERYGSQDSNPIESVQFDPPEGIFLVAWLDGQPVGCGGWRTIAHFAEDGTPAGVAADGEDHGALAERVADLGERVEVLPDRLLVYGEDGDEVVAKVHERGLAPVATLVRRSSLEDVFLRLTGRTLVD